MRIMLVLRQRASSSLTTLGNLDRRAYDRGCRRYDGHWIHSQDAVDDQAVKTLLKSNQKTD